MNNEFRLNPYAFFDALYVIRHLEDSLGNANLQEVHLFSYLACLLSLYRGKPVSRWGYQFAGTKMGAPFSSDIESSVRYLNVGGYVVRDAENNLKLSGRGIQELMSLSTLTRNEIRKAFLDGACSTLVALPVGAIREAVFSEPELRNSLALSSARNLLDGPGMHTLYEQFSALSKAIGVETEDLMVPGVLWLTYLTRVSERENDMKDGPAA